MVSLGEFWSDLVRNFFASFSPDDGQDDESPRRTAFSRDGETCAAPCSAYQPRIGGPDCASFAQQNGSVCAASVCEQAARITSVAPSPAAVPEYVAESIIIPFKDGSSQIMTRPSFLQASDPQMNLLGGSWLRSDAYRAREGHFFISDPEDIVDMKVAEYFKAKPWVYLETKFTRTRPGVYSMKGREVQVEWTEGQLIIIDGVLKQPFAEYFETSKEPRTTTFVAPTPEFSGSVFKAKNNLQTIPKECRVTFNDAGFDYSRIDAMKVAKEQASLREAAAKMMTQTGQVPVMDRLSSRYEKSMDQKLGSARARRHTEVSMGIGSSPPSSRSHASIRMSAGVPRKL